MQIPHIAALLILLALLTSLMLRREDGASQHDQEGYRTFGDPRVQFLLADEKMGPVDVFLNERLITTTLTFGQATGYLPVRRNRTYRLQLRGADGGRSFVKELDLDRFRGYTVIIMGDNDYGVLDDSSWHFAARRRRAPVVRLVDLTQRDHPLEVLLRNAQGHTWYWYRWRARQWTDWIQVAKKGAEQLELHANGTSLVNATLALQRGAGYNFFLLPDPAARRYQGFCRPAFTAAPLQSVTEDTFCLSVILLVWCNALHRLYLAFWTWLHHTSLRPAHSRTLPSIREVNMFLYSVTMAVGFALFVAVSADFLRPIGLVGVWEGVTHTALATRLDYYQNYFKALGVVVVVLYTYELITDPRMPVSTVIHHGGAIAGTIFLLSFTDDIAEFWFGWISLAYVQFELLLFWGLYLRDLHARTGRAKALSERVLIGGWLSYMIGMVLEVTFYTKAVVSLWGRVAGSFLAMSGLVMAVWLLEQLMCLCCTARSIKRKDLLKDAPFLEVLCWLSWWVARYPAAVAKFSSHLLHEDWDGIPKANDATTRCAVTVHNIPFTVWVPNGSQKDLSAKLQRVRLQAAEELETVANTLLTEDLSAPVLDNGVEHYSVNHQSIRYGT
jgi:hypothetical protein